MAQYEAAIAGEHAVRKSSTAKSGCLRWLWARYRESAAWEKLSPATRRQRENILRPILEKGGDQAFVAVKRKNIEESLDARRKTPCQARNFLDAMKGLFRWAKKNEHIKTDPTEGVENPERKKSKGFPPWTEGDVAAYQQKYPLGTCERVWLDMILYTGPRRGDVFRLGRQHVRSQIESRTGMEVRLIVFHTEKGGEMMEVAIPILPILQATLDAGPCGDLTFIVGKSGKPFGRKESFGNAFSAAARKAGIKKSAHGVRKIAATTAADNGATEHQLMAIFGWRTTAMAERYTREANRRRLARSAAHMLERTPEQPIRVLPDDSVRLPAQKR
ncbi:MAG TPA: tyrosine-type recombinase/integrase [Rhizomicrobium sp.]|nr:tyrosine-type recombinase/integrase [Rhizomicrobium sp.]